MSSITMCDHCGKKSTDEDVSMLLGMIEIRFAHIGRTARDPAEKGIDPTTITALSRTSELCQKCFDDFYPAIQRVIDGQYKPPG
jgi:hypothetical protein